MSLADKIRPLDLAGGTFSRNVIILMTGTVIAQAVPLAVSPVLTRIFSPDDFGLFALYFSISQIICVFVTARYESAIILPEDDKDSINILALSLIITSLVSILTLALVIAARVLFMDMLTGAGLYNYILLMPLTVFSIGIYNTFNLWLNRKQRFHSISAGKIIRSVFSSGLSIGFGFSVLKAFGLILADTIGQFIAGTYVLIRSLKYNSNLLAHVSRSGIAAMAKRYARFPKFNVVSGLFEKGAGQMPVILLSSFFGSSVTGLFSLSQRIIAAPGALIGVSVGDVFRQHASVEFKQKGNCHNTFLKLFRLLVAIGIVPFTVILLFAPFLFSFIFGSEWRIAGEYAQIMTVMFFLSFIVSPLSNMFIIAEKQNIDLIIQIFLFMLVTISFIAGYNVFNHPKAAIALYTIIYSLKYCVEFYLSLQFSKGKKVVNPGIS